jgi:hypothetical protein
LNIIIEDKHLLFHCIDHKNYIIFKEILKKSSELINYTNINLITYLFKIKKLEENIFMRFIMLLIENKYFKSNYYDEHNSHIGFLILDSELSKRNKIILFKLLNNKIDPIIIKNNIPLIMYSVVLDEYEISYMLLNIMIVNKQIKKNQNSIINSFLSYELSNDTTIINFIPIIFKYIKENPDKNQIIVDEIYLFEDAYIENILVMIIEIIVCFMIHTFTNIDNKLVYNLNDEYYAKTNENINEQDNTTGYLTIDPNINDNMQNEHLYMEISIDNDNALNKNIWYKSNTSSNIKNKISNINFKLKSESPENNFLFNTHSESSNISENEICFSNII